MVLTVSIVSLACLISLATTPLKLSIVLFFTAFSTSNVQHVFDRGHVPAIIDRHSIFHSLIFYCFIGFTFIVLFECTFYISSLPCFLLSLGLEVNVIVHVFLTTRYHFHHN